MRFWTERRPGSLAAEGLREMPGKRKPGPGSLAAEGRDAMADYKKSDPFYHSKEWKRIRQVALMRDGGMCQDCMDRMRDGYGIKPRRATMVHHIIPREERPDLALKLENLRSLCDECHNREHPEKWKKLNEKKAGKEQPSFSMRVVKV